MGFIAHHSQTLPMLKKQQLSLRLNALTFKLDI